MDNWIDDYYEELQQERNEAEDYYLTEQEMLRYQEKVLSDLKKLIND